MPKIGKVRQPRDAKGRFRSTKKQKAIIAKSRRSATKPTLASMKGAEKWVVFRKKTVLLREIQKFTLDKSKPEAERLE